MATIISPSDMTSQQTDLQDQEPYCRRGQKDFDWQFRFTLNSELLYVDSDQFV